MPARTIYFLGIGGIGMSALARYYHVQGWQVSGYDKTPSPLTDELIAEGITVVFTEDVEHIPEAEIYVYTPAVPSSHPAFKWVESSGGNWIKRSQLLELVTQGKKTIAIAGTHGKTTTTSIVAHLLHQTSANVSAFVGGVMAGYNSNLIATADPEYVIVEADEYDRSFLRLNPSIAVITSLDPDHLDIYGTFEAMKADYRTFAGRSDLLIVHESISHEFDHTNKIVYGVNPKSDGVLSNVGYSNGLFQFELERQAYQCQLPGLHNALNASAAILVASNLGVSPSRLADALSEFKGVRRRFERVVDKGHVQLIDDYAHHPKEIEAAIQTARMMFENAEIGVVFQPHLYSRTKDFEDEFASSLSLADKVVLMPIYPARELPIDGVSSANLLKKLTLKTKVLAPKTEVVNAVLSLAADVVLVLGAGDIDRLVQPIATALIEKEDA